VVWRKVSGLKESEWFRGKKDRKKRENRQINIKTVILSYKRIEDIYFLLSLESENKDQRSSFPSNNLIYFAFSLGISAVVD